MRWLLTSRRRVALVTLGLLLLLDLARSIYANIGYANPAEPWQAAPYQAIAWPPGSDLVSDAPVGQRVYAQRCAICHGPNGRGDGPAAPSLIPDRATSLWASSSISLPRLASHQPTMI
jgi:mono/diheme cytochrome c family protein